MKKEKKVTILKVFIFGLFLFLGLFVRIKVPHETLTGNTVAFYFSRAEYLERTGEYLKIDNTTFAGYPYKENYPPFPSLASVPLYKLVKPFGVDFNKFISYFPVLMFLAIFFVGFFIVRGLFNENTALFFIGILSVIPVSVRATIKNYYTEEALGILFIILSLYYISKIKKFDYNFFFAIAFLTLLSLTWQVFLLIDLVIFILFLINLKDKKLRMILPLLILSQFALGHFFSVYIVDINYSPIYMIKESIITLQEGDKDYFKIAFDRSDLRTPGINQITNEFGYFTSLLILLGFIHLIFNIKEQKNQVIFLVGTIAAFTFLYSSKFRFFAAAPLVIVGSLSSAPLLDFKSIKKREKIGILLLIIFLILYFIAGKIAIPSCSVTLETPESIEAGKYYPVMIVVKNNGFDPQCDTSTGAFGGLHFEMDDTTILNISIDPSYTNISTKYRVPYRNINWFETKIDCLKRKQNSTVTVWIMPKSNKIGFHYRCWLPKKDCVKEPPIGMRPQYKASWRNEECIQRTPNRGDFCKVRVYAGYYNQTDFYCDTKEIG